MTRVVVHPEVCATLSPLDGPAELCDETGQILGYFHPAIPLPRRGAKALSPFTDEEIRRRQQQRTGRPLSEIVADLSRS